MRMSESKSFAERLASSVGMEGKQPLRFTLAAGGILLALALAVVMLRFYRLGEIPPALAGDELVDGDLALQVLQGEHAVFFPVDQGRDASAIYALGLSTNPLRPHLAGYAVAYCAGKRRNGLCRLLAGFAPFWERPMWPDHAVAGSNGWRRCGRTHGRFNRSNSSRTIRVQQDHTHALFACPLPGPCLARVEASELVVDCVCGRVRGTVALHLYPGSIHALPVSLLWFELYSTSPFSCL